MSTLSLASVVSKWGTGSVAILVSRLIGRGRAARVVNIVRVLVEVLIGYADIIGAVGPVLLIGPAPPPPAGWW